MDYLLGHSNETWQAVVEGTLKEWDDVFRKCDAARYEIPEDITDLAEGIGQTGAVLEESREQQSRFDHPVD